MKKIKNKEKFDPFKNLVLDDYERGIEEAFEKGEFKRIPDYENEKKMFQEAATNYRVLQQTKRISLRVKNEYLIKVKVRAKKFQIPYQRLLNSLIHQFAEGETSITI